jgi:pimeloyl-ACP methyl ester carboxylesterase
MPMIDTGEVKLHYEEKGSGIALVFLHGFTLDNVKGSEIDVVPGAGHMSNIEAPDRFNSRLERFLDRVEGDL